jgi:hypothetical protein
VALPKYKDIIELVKKGSTIEAQEKILELREAAIELQEDNIELKEEIASLKSQLKNKAEMEFNGHVYYRNSDGEREGPFCPHCFDVHTKIVRIHPVEYAYSNPEWQCKSCESRYSKAENA